MFGAAVVAIAGTVGALVSYMGGDGTQAAQRFQCISRSSTDDIAVVVDVLRDTATGRCYAVAWGVYSGALLDPDVPCGEAGP